MNYEKAKQRALEKLTHQCRKLFLGRAQARRIINAFNQAVSTSRSRTMNGEPDTKVVIETPRFWVIVDAGSIEIHVDVLRKEIHFRTKIPQN
jgi:hypothetical protein